jgi:hypothetical protein
MDRRRNSGLSLRRTEQRSDSEVSLKSTRGSRMSFETSFDWKQPKLESKLVSTVSETKCLFQMFCFYIPKQRVSKFRLNRKEQKTNQNNLIESIFWKILGFSWFVSKQFCLFRLFRYRFKKHRNKPKKTPKFLFLVSRNKQKHNQNRSCFHLFRFEPKFFFFRFQDILRGSPHSTMGETGVRIDCELLVDFSQSQKQKISQLPTFADFCHQC